MLRRGAEHCPELTAELDRLRDLVGPRAEQRRAKAHKTQLERAASARLNLARTALHEHRFPEALTAFREILAELPENSEALAGAALALERTGQVDETLPLYERLASLEPSNPVWSQWVKELRREPHRAANSWSNCCGRPVAAGRNLRPARAVVVELHF